MYWFREEALLSVLGLGTFLVLLAVGGWLIARSCFRLNRHERWFTGISIGVACYVFLGNILGHFLPTLVAFWGSAILILVLGILAGILTKTRIELDIGKETIAQFLVFFVLVGVITLIGRGLGIFDDRKNLSIISTMAAGDIPPHFYMNSDFYFGYHYGFQLFAASLMRVGGLFPWSAFDLGKALLGALVLMLAFLWGWRISARKMQGYLLSAWVALASGTRWLLLLVPPSILAWAGSQLQLWGSGAQSAATFLQSLSASWVVEGGPPAPMPFAFVNGIMQPFVLHVQAGPKSLALVIFLLLLLLVRRTANRYAYGILLMLFSAWALAAEAEFVLIVLGLGLAALIMRFWRRDKAWRAELRAVVLVVFLASLVSLLQGGTITELARGLLVNDTAQPLVDAESGLPFMLRLPPAFVSSHLGEMRLTSPGEAFIAFFELGPIALLAFVVLYRGRSWQKHGRFYLQSVLFASLAGFVVPIFLRYQVDRDITRLTNFALYSWLLLGWLIWSGIRRTARRRWFPKAMAVAMVLSSFAGLVILGSLMTAIPKPVFADGIDPIDAAMTRDLWDELPEGSLVLDSSGWRAVAVTGRLTRSAADSYEMLDSWEDLLLQPDASRVLSQGYQYVYIDKYWWDSMNEKTRRSYEAPCSKLVGERFDNGANGARWLYDLRGCQP
jgi:hypothetical protein